MLPGVDVADDAGRGLELVQFLTRLGIDSLQISFERSVEHDVARCREGTAPHRERLRIRPHDLTLARIPGDEVAEVRAARRRIHAERRTHIGLPSGVADAEGL